MPSKRNSTDSSASTPPSSADTGAVAKIPGASGVDLQAMQQSRDQQKIVSWVKSAYEAAKSARQTKQTQWYVNLAFYYGKQDVRMIEGPLPQGYNTPLMIPRKTPQSKQKTKRVINRVRSVVRTEHSKFLSSIPQAIVVPATSEEQDVRAAFAGEQAWESISEGYNWRNIFTRAQWWTILTGNGFVKEWWDNDEADPVAGVQGCIKAEPITPFNLFVPDLREEEIEDQPYVIYASVKSAVWCNTFFAQELGGRVVKPSVASANSIVDEGHLNLSTAGRKPDSCVIYEAWVKPGATELLPQGGLVICIDDMLVGFIEGLPYNHQQYPFTHFKHIPTGTFYADSPLVDIIELQKEYNDLRSDISWAGRVMGRPQLAAPKGSIVGQKMSNETGLLIEFKAGMQPPQPLPMAQLPQYLIEQQNTILSDIEDLTGQHEVSKGDAPAGITAGTAINYLQEKDDSFLTPQYQSVEDGNGKVAHQALSLFNQYVDLPRKIKVIGADEAFDTLMLQGSDLDNSTDVRIERGSSIGQSKAASDARVMDLFQMGLIDQPTALRLLEIGGAQKVLDVMNAAQKKAQRENIRMKMLTPEQIQAHQIDFELQQMQQFMGGQNFPEPSYNVPQAQPTLPGMGDDQLPGTDDLGQSAALAGGLNNVSGQGPQDTGADATGAMNMQDPFSAPGQPPQAGPVIAVDDFDVHQIHIDEHNKFRMSQEFEALPTPIKQQFALHVQQHQFALQQGQLQNFLKMIPSDGSDGSAPDRPNDVVTNGPGHGSVADNGAVPAAGPGISEGGGQ